MNDFVDSINACKLNTDGRIRHCVSYLYVNKLKVTIFCLCSFFTRPLSHLGSHDFKLSFVMLQ